jgi:hypothetical protein
LNQDVNGLANDDNTAASGESVEAMPVPMRRR